LGGPQNRSGRGGEEKNSQPLPGIEPPIIQPVAQRYLNKLSRLMIINYDDDDNNNNNNNNKGNIYLRHPFQTGSGVYPDSYQMGTGGSFLGVKVTWA
jgi:hypothetical protein